MCKLKRRLQRLTGVYTFQNVTLLEISCTGSNVNGLILLSNIVPNIKPDQADVTPPLNKNGQICIEERDKANILNNCFTEQTLLDESQATLPQTVKNTTYKLDSIFVTPEEVRDI